MFNRIEPLAAVALLPYLAWVAFAAVLNYTLLKMNPQVRPRYVHQKVQAQHMPQQQQPGLLLTYITCHLIFWRAGWQQASSIGLHAGAVQA